MEFFARVPSSNSRTREAEQVNETFKSNLDVLKSLLQYGESSDVSSLMDVVYEKSSPEERIFMKTPTQARLRSKEELVVRILNGLLSRGVPTMAEMLAFIKKHGVEGIASTLVSLLELLCPLLDGKETPKFTSDDVVDAIDFGWHFGSPAASPLRNVISVGDSPLHPIAAASPFQRIVSYARLLMNVVESASPNMPEASTSQVPELQLDVNDKDQHESATGRDPFDKAPVREENLELFSSYDDAQADPASLTVLGGTQAVGNGGSATSLSSDKTFTPMGETNEKPSESNNGSAAADDKGSMLMNEGLCVSSYDHDDAKAKQGEDSQLPLSANMESFASYDSASAKDEHCNKAHEASLCQLSQVNERNALQHVFHHRSHSDATPEWSLLQADKIKEKDMPGSRSARRSIRKLRRRLFGRLGSAVTEDPSVEHQVPVEDAQQEDESSHKGFKFQSILAPLLLSSSSIDLPLNFDEYVTDHAGEDKFRQDIQSIESQVDKLPSSVSTREDHITMKKDSGSTKDETDSIADDTVAFSRETGYTQCLSPSPRPQTTREAANADLVTDRVSLSDSSGVISTDNHLSETEEGSYLIVHHQNDPRAIPHPGHDVSAGDCGRIDAHKLLTDKIDTHRRPISEHTSAPEISILQEHEGLSVQSQRQMPEYSEVKGKADGAQEDHSLNAAGGFQEEISSPTVPSNTSEDDIISNMQPSISMGTSVLFDDHDTHEVQDELPMMSKRDLEEHLQFIDSQFEQLLADIDATEDDASAAASEPALVAKNDAEDGDEKNHDEVGSRVGDGVSAGLDCDNGQVHVGCSLRSDNAFLLSDVKLDGKNLHFDLTSDVLNARPSNKTARLLVENSTLCHRGVPSALDLETGFEERDGQFIVGGPGDISTQINCNQLDDQQISHSHTNEEEGMHQRSKKDLQIPMHQRSKKDLQIPHLEDVHQRSDHQRHSLKTECKLTIDNIDETRLHVIENKVREASASASLASQYDGEEDMEYAAEGKKHTKVDMKSNENKQDLKHPSVWEASGVVNASITHPLHQTDKDDRESRKLEICNSMVQHAAPVNENGFVDQAYALEHDQGDDADEVSRELDRLYGHPEKMTPSSNHLEPKHVLNQQACLGDRRVEWSDMELHAAQSRKKRGYARKLVNNCLACCRKPRTIS